MPARRLRPVQHPVTVHLGGRPVVAEKGEPLVLTGLLAGWLPWSRSVKYHRPRGPTCLRGRCDGCLCRVDGLPSRQACRQPAREGLRVERQSVLGSPDLDPMALGDAVFRRGIDHHRMGTATRLANRASVRIVRALSGLGRLPDAPVEQVPVGREETDVLVVGAGPSGLAAAVAAAEHGAEVLLFDEEPAIGGHLLDTPSPRARHTLQRLEERLAHARSLGARWLPSHQVVGVYEEPGRGSPLPPPTGPDPLRDVEAPDAPELLSVLLLAEAGLRVVTTRSLVLATGLQAAAPPFVNGDLPGVYTARAAARALRFGVLLGEPAALLGQGEAIERLAEALGEAGAQVRGPLPLERVRRCVGRRGRLAAVELDDGTRWPVEAAFVDAGADADVRLVVQAGGTCRWEGARLLAASDPADGRTDAPWLWVVGEASGVDAAEDSAAQAAAAGRAAAERAARRSLHGGLQP